MARTALPNPKALGGTWPERDQHQASLRPHGRPRPPSHPQPHLAGGRGLRGPCSHELSEKNTIKKLKSYEQAEEGALGEPGRRQQSAVAPPVSRQPHASFPSPAHPSWPGKGTSPQEAERRLQLLSSPLLFSPLLLAPPGFSCRVLPPASCRAPSEVPALNGVPKIEPGWALHLAGGSALWEGPQDVLPAPRLVPG